MLKYSESNYGRVQRRSKALGRLLDSSKKVETLSKPKATAYLSLRGISSSQAKAGPKSLSSHSHPYHWHAQRCCNSAPRGDIERTSNNGVQQGRQHDRCSWSLLPGQGCLPRRTTPVPHLRPKYVYALCLLRWNLQRSISKFRGIEPMIKTILKYKISVWWIVPPQIVLFCKDPSVPPYLEELRKVGRFAWSVRLRCQMTSVDSSPKSFPSSIGGKVRV